LSSRPGLHRLLPFHSMAALEYVEVSTCETGAETARLEDGAAPGEPPKRAAPAWRALAVISGALLLAAAGVAVFTSSSSLAGAGPPPRAASPVVASRGHVAHRTIALFARARLHKKVALNEDPEPEPEPEAEDMHSVQQDMQGAEESVDPEHGEQGPPSFSLIDADGDGKINMAEVEAYCKGLGMPDEEWDQEKEYIKGDFKSADTDGDEETLSEEEFLAMTAPGTGCESHDDCSGDDPFCYSGHCAPCDECHYCWDGIDGTCGGCGDGFPTEEDACESVTTSLDESVTTSLDSDEK